MPRAILAEDRIHPAIREKVAAFHAGIVREVEAAIAANDIVVVGMSMNPFPRKARKVLDAAGLAYKYLGYGSYVGEWRPRSAQDVERLAHVSDGVREGRAGGRRGRPRASGRLGSAEGLSLSARA